MLRAWWQPYRLDFKFTAITSRQAMRHKDTYFVCVCDTERPQVVGHGECALFAGLSAESGCDYMTLLDEACADPVKAARSAVSSIRFGFETALADMNRGGHYSVFDNDWVKGDYGITTNGLVWMGSRELMAERIESKLAQGFRCLKLKIGGIDFDDEVELIRCVRKRFGADVLELRLDANGAFKPDEALRRLDVLSAFDVHSIEQPIRAGQIEDMARICAESPVAIALDEELIGVTDSESKRQMLTYVRPSYIILKPSLCGGFAQADEWIDIAVGLGIGWWATSALESNVGLNAIAQWVAAKRPVMPQGLGTGLLYSNNIMSPLELRGQALFYNPQSRWRALPLL